MLRLTCLLRLAITAFLLYQSVPGMTRERTSTSLKEVENYVLLSCEKVCRTVDDIVEIPLSERTFENTFGKWADVAEEIAFTMRALDTDEYAQYAHDYYCFLRDEVFENVTLRDVLFYYAQYSPLETLSPYQRYLMDCFFKNAYERQTCELAFSTIQGSAEEENALEKGEKALKAHADVIYFEAMTPGELGKIYDSLKEQYAYFYTTVKPYGLASDFLRPSSGHLIASKCLLNQSELMAFVKSGLKEDSLHFINPKVSRPNDLFSLCKHKEKVEIEHETDDNGKSKTKVGAQFEYENKEGYWMKGKGWAEKKEDKGKPVTESGVEVELGKKF